MRLKTPEGIVFYATTKEDIKDLSHQMIRLNIFNQSIHFLDYLKGFYAFNIKMELLPQQTSIKDDIRYFISKQHESAIISNLYQTLFLADTLNPQ